MNHSKSDSKVAIVNPPGLWTLDSYSHPKLICENLGLQYIVSELINAGFNVFYRDAFLQGWTNVQTCEYIISTQASIVGISIMFPSVEDQAIELARLLKQQRSELIIVVGGASPTLHPDKFITEPAIDHVIQGEGEKEMIEIVKNNIKKSSNRSITLRESINDLPRPQHQYGHMIAKKKGSILVNTSRGCVANCNFCAIKALYPNNIARYRTRDLYDVFAEMTDIKRKTGIISFVFTDDNFLNGDKAERMERLDEFVNASKKYDFKGNIYLDIRSPDVNPEVLAKLKEAGVAIVFVGIEAGSSRDLDYFRKGSKVTDNSRAIKYIQAAKIGLEFGYITYNPESTIEIVKLNIEFLSNHNLLGPGHLISRLKLFHGTRFYQQYMTDDLFYPEDSMYGYIFRHSNVERLFEDSRRICADMISYWNIYDLAHWNYWMLTKPTERSPQIGQALLEFRARLSEEVFQRWSKLLEGDIIGDRDVENLNKASAILANC